MRAGGEAAREGEIESLIVQEAAPIAQRIVRSHGAAEGMAAAEVEDVLATVSLRLVVKLRAASESVEHAIEDFSKYVAAVTYNALADSLRRRFPERARLKTLLRYVLTHDARLALWTTEGGPVCGLVAWRGRDAVEEPLDLTRPTRRMLVRERPGDALADLFQQTGRPLSLAALVGAMAELWKVVDREPVQLDAEPATAPAPLFETRGLLRSLWSEIRQLRPMQRRALLLNLRDDESVNLVALLVAGGIAAAPDLAAALEMSAEELSAIWNDLPLDDRRIAEILGLTRQQVINLRKSARERLARRLAYPRRQRS